MKMTELKRLKTPLLVAVGLLVLMAYLLLPFRQNAVWGQFPTVSIPTVTGSPRGVYVKAHGHVGFETLNIRSYPNSTATLIGVFVAGQEAKAYGSYGDYVQIDYIGAPSGKGWVVLAGVDVLGGTLPALEPPPTETPAVTKTIDPTLAAQFLITVQATRLPTYTEPPALQIPTYQTESGGIASGGIPMGFIILALLGLGLVFTLIATLRRG